MHSARHRLIENCADAFYSHVRLESFDRPWRVRLHPSLAFSGNPLVVWPQLRRNPPDSAQSLVPVLSAVPLFRSRLCPSLADESRPAIAPASSFPFTMAVQVLPLLAALAPLVSAGYSSYSLQVLTCFGSQALRLTRIPVPIQRQLAAYQRVRSDRSTFKRLQHLHALSLRDSSKFADAQPSLQYNDCGTTDSPSSM